MLKSIIVVGAAAGVGAVVGEMLFAKLPAEKLGGPNIQKGAKIGTQAATAAVVFGIFNSLL